MLAVNEMSGRYSVRQILSPAEVKEIFFLRAASLDWKPGALDHECYFAADERGFFAGELDGKVISCLFAIKYSREYAYIGNYIVDEPHRGKGYGLELWKAAHASLPEGCNSALDSVEEMVEKYKKYGYIPQWKIQRMTYIALHFLSEMRYPDEVTNEVIIKPANEVPFCDLLSYDTSVFVYARPSFLKKWTTATNCFSYAAIDYKNTIIGYTVVRKTLRPEDGWMIGPLYADNVHIAKILYETVFERVSVDDPRGMVTINVPHGNALNLARQIPSKEIATFVRMYRQQTSSKNNMPPEKIFGIIL